MSQDYDSGAGVGVLIRAKDAEEGRIGSSFKQSLTLLAVNILNKSTLFEAFEGDVFRSPPANLKGCGSRTVATIKMELFDQVILCLGILKRNTIVLVAGARALCGVWPICKKMIYCIGKID